MRSQISRNIKFFVFLFVSLAVSGLACGSDYTIGVYYFPGWKDRQPYAPAPFPWERIKYYPERKPLLGWYAEGDDHLMNTQLGWMRDHGIKFVAFDWYMGRDRRVYLEHSLAAYFRAQNRKDLKFTVLWANHDKFPSNIGDWDAMIRYWVKYYFPKSEFFRISGKPVVFVFSADALKIQAESFGETSKSLIARAQDIAKENGFEGIVFVAGSGANVPMISSYAKTSGYSGFSAYNYHGGPGDSRQSHSYPELDIGYRSQWNKFAENGNLPLIVPMTSGWDMRPWGGSKDALHDHSLSTSIEFRHHLEAARSFMDKHPVLTNRMGVICCWNEYGEGSFIEPTQKDGFDYLDQVKEVFGGVRR